jgi:hypothetical protein
MHKFKVVYEEDDSLCGGCLNERKLVSTFTTYSDDTWDVALKGFTDFLSHIYGYDISDKIYLKTVFGSDHFKNIDDDSEIAQRVRDALREDEDDEDTPSST